jgi:hypothetical protein
MMTLGNVGRGWGKREAGMEIVWAGAVKDLMSHSKKHVYYVLGNGKLMSILHGERECSELVIGRALQ